MYKQKHTQRTISLVNGDFQKEMDFSDIQGPTLAYATRIIGALPVGETANLAMYDGATEVLSPIDIGVSEVSTKNSIQGMQIPLTVENPGRISARLTPSATLTSGQDYKVVVIIWYAVEMANPNTPRISDCN